MKLFKKIKYKIHRFLYGYACSSEFLEHNEYTSYTALLEAMFNTKSTENLVYYYYLYGDSIDSICARFD